MIYFETIKPMILYKSNEIAEAEVITEYPCFADSAWMRIKTREGMNFYLCRKQLEEMQDHPQWYPTEERRKYELFAPVQT